MTIFRPCPSAPGYSVSAAGVVRRDEYDRVLKDGSTKAVPAAVIDHVGRDALYVTLRGKFVRWDALVHEAWGRDVEMRGRPKSSYRDGEVWTLVEYRAWLRARR